MSQDYFKGPNKLNLNYAIQRLKESRMTYLNYDESQK